MKNRNLISFQNWVLP